MFSWKKSWPFGLFSGDKDDYSDVWMIKTTIKRNEILYGCLLLLEEYNIQNHVCSNSPAFFF